MEKVVYLVRERASRDGADLREQALGEVVPAVAAAGGTGISAHLADDAVSIGGPMPCPGGELPLRAVLGVWLPAHDRHAAVAGSESSVPSRISSILPRPTSCTSFRLPSMIAPRGIIRLPGL